MSDNTETSILCRKMNPSRQYLVGKLRDYYARVHIYKIRYANDQEKLAITEVCQSHLDDISTMLNHECAKRFKKTFTVWHLFHRVDEYFYLLMTETELKAQGWELLQGLKISPVSQQTKTEWIVKIQEVLKKFDGPNKATDEDVREAAHSFSTAAYIHNDCVDNLFWDYWCRKFFALMYTAGLMVALLLFMLSYYHSKFALCAWTAMLIGSIGGLVSGIMTTQIESIPYGQFWVSTYYHVFIRPIQGAVAALMVFWMLQSQYMVKIDPPMAQQRIIFSASSSSRIELPMTGLPSAPTSKFGIASSSRSVAKSDPLLVLKAAQGMQVYLYMLVLLIAGFTGDKALRYVSDKVSGRLFAEAEKTKEAK